MDDNTSQRHTMTSSRCLSCHWRSDGRATRSGGQALIQAGRRVAGRPARTPQKCANASTLRLKHATPACRTLVTWLDRRTNALRPTRRCTQPFTAASNTFLLWLCIRLATSPLGGSFHAGHFVACLRAASACSCHRIEFQGIFPGEAGGLTLDIAFAMSSSSTKTPGSGCNNSTTFSSQSSRLWVFAETSAAKAPVVASATVRFISWALSFGIPSTVRVCFESASMTSKWHVAHMIPGETRIVRR